MAEQTLLDEALAGVEDLRVKIEEFMDEGGFDSTYRTSSLCAMVESRCDLVEQAIADLYEDTFPGIRGSYPGMPGNDDDRYNESE